MTYQYALVHVSKLLSSSNRAGVARAAKAELFTIFGDSAPCASSTRIDEVRLLSKFIQAHGMLALQCEYTSADTQQRSGMAIQRPCR